MCIEVINKVVKWNPGNIDTFRYSLHQDVLDPADERFFIL